MPDHVSSPGVFIQEIPDGVHAITGGRVQAQSRLVRWRGAWPPNPLPVVAAADDDVTKGEKQLAAANAGTPPVQADIDNARQALAAAKTAMAASDGLPLTLKDSFNPAQAQAAK
ncbi:hypothetical protein IC762_22380 [Bradyrhizobium genosp. L]|uniref:hypothetical protein n=1 Tax=Bradyrhizobium genosp. L TaxID=83637 RepID=UPI0018A259F9|nr:hypothetical protein [Bradyrhizobium genosp. L]QPF82497.1 hypothetical protein IC762_22380 [Bradyrhizobium genosp. L]